MIRIHQSGHWPQLLRLYILQKVDITLLLLTNCIFLCVGNYDHLPEQAFYMVGPIEEAVAKADKLAEEHAS